MERLDLSIPGFDPPGPGPSFAGIKDLIPDIPMLAAGGTITRGGLAVVGERGAELLSLPTGAAVEPLGAGAGSGPVTLKSELHVHGGDVPTLAELDYVNRVQAHRLVALQGR